MRASLAELETAWHGSEQTLTERRKCSKPQVKDAGVHIKVGTVKLSRNFEEEGEPLEAVVSEAVQREAIRQKDRSYRDKGKGSSCCVGLSKQALNPVRHVKSEVRQDQKIEEGAEGNVDCRNCGKDKQVSSANRVVEDRTYKDKIGMARKKELAVLPATTLVRQLGFGSNEEMVEAIAQRHPRLQTLPAVTIVKLLGAGLGLGGEYKDALEDAVIALEPVSTQLNVRRGKGKAEVPRFGQRTNICARKAAEGCD